MCFSGSTYNCWENHKNKSRLYYIKCISLCMTWRGSDCDPGPWTLTKNIYIRKLEQNVFLNTDLKSYDLALFRRQPHGRVVKMWLDACLNRINTLIVFRTCVNDTSRTDYVENLAHSASCTSVAAGGGRKVNGYVRYTMERSQANGVFNRLKPLECTNCRK